MSGFNKGGAPAHARTAQLRSPVRTRTDAPDTATYNGADAWTRKPKGELFMLAVTNFVGEDTFYEGASVRDTRFRDLVRKVTQKDPEWVARFIPWLRSEANMRTASIVAAVEFAQVYKAKPHEELTARSVVSAALQRADEPGEALAYAKAQGYPLAGGFQRGVADAAVRLYTERSLLKYDSESKDFRFGDVLELTHPKTTSDWQAALFDYAITRRHGRENVELHPLLHTLQARENLMKLPVEARRALVRVAAEAPESYGAAQLRDAGMTWEALSGWLQGPMDAVAWTAAIPNMGYMALLRNLRNFDQAGVSDEVAGSVAAKLANADEVARSRQLPMRFLSAYNAAPSLRWSWPLEQALQHSLRNVPQLRGRTLVLIDTSSSMNAGFSRDGSLKRWDAAAMFGIALALRAESADVVSFGGNHIEAFPFAQASSLLKALDDFKRNYFYGGGTPTVAAIQRFFAGHDRVVILTDEQADRPSHVFGARYGHDVSSVTVEDAVPHTVPMFNFNLAGYRPASTSEGKENRHAFGGLTDHGFKAIALLESRRNAEWPF